MTEQQNLSKGQLLEQQSREEQIAFKAWRAGFAQRVPPPQRPASVNISNLGLQFWLYFQNALASIALAAMRTWDSFNRVAFSVTQNTFYAQIEAWLAVLVVELGMVVYAASMAHKSYQKKESIRRAQAEAEGRKYHPDKSVETKGSLMIIGLILLVFLSMNAGLDQSVRSIKNVSPALLEILSYVLNLTIGVGVSFIAYVGGETLGQQLAIVTADFQERADAYEDELAAYNEDAEAAWAHSDERSYIRAEIRGAAKAARGNQSTSPLTGPLSGLSVNYSQGGAFGQGRRPPVITTQVYQYMDQILQTENRVASFSEVQQTLEIPKSTASKLRLQWIQERDVAINENEVSEGVEE